MALDRSLWTLNSRETRRSAIPHSLRSASVDARPSPLSALAFLSLDEKCTLSPSTHSNLAAYPHVSRFTPKCKCGHRLSFGVRSVFYSPLSQRTPSLHRMLRDTRKCACGTPHPSVEGIVQAGTIVGVHVIVSPKLDVPQFVREDAREQREPQNEPHSKTALCHHLNDDNLSALTPNSFIFFSWVSPPEKRIVSSLLGNRILISKFWGFQSFEKVNFGLRPDFQFLRPDFFLSTASKPYRRILARSPGV